jgi:hypothetical protein
LALLRRFFLASVTCCALLALPAGASAATTITAEKSLDGNTNCAWGYPDTATFGQTIVAPQGDTVLDSFTFHLTARPDPLTGLPPTTPATIDYRAYVYAWDGTKAVGPAVWSSGTQSVTIADFSAVPVTAETGGVELASGASYVLFFSISEEYGSNSPGDEVCFVAARSDYADGAWVFQNNGGDATTWTSQSWGSGFDSAFSASFSSADAGTTYDFDGFYAPVETRDATGSFVLNRAAAGSGIPVRFSLGGDQGLDVLADGYPRSEAIACDSQAEVNGIEQTVNVGASTLTYSPGTDTYSYLWKTSRAWADTCRQLVLEFDDGTVARANFAFTN